MPHVVVNSILPQTKGYEMSDGEDQIERLVKTSLVCSLLATRYTIGLSCYRELEGSVDT